MRSHFSTPFSGWEPVCPQALCEHYRASWAEAVRTSSAQDRTRQQDLARLGLGDAAGETSEFTPSATRDPRRRLEFRGLW